MYESGASLFSLSFSLFPLLMHGRNDVLGTALLPPIPALPSASDSSPPLPAHTASKHCDSLRRAAGRRSGSKGRVGSLLSDGGVDVVQFGSPFFSSLFRPSPSLTERRGRLLQRVDVVCCLRCMCSSSMSGYSERRGKNDVRNHCRFCAPARWV
jgi:hypothetical protein